MSKHEPASVHTTPSPEGGWDNQRDGKKFSHHDTKEEAQARGREEAKKRETEHKIHNRDGKISESNSYGNDPFPPKG
ncbi:MULTISPECIES: DUF2188 domain-containing protein [Paenibacillus]|uniref:DUF2188 domain-containing protein n=1 Tax=Paenibacillus TaxID=44249 RepID=UPI001C30D799|nr:MULTISPECIES: DUF2188 domain-containing protein [Paenibacillus]MEC0246443.1 DUF2188 domain-containing protein [Paenibacillus chitinolyticus]